MSLFPSLGRLQFVVLLYATLVGVVTVNADTLTVTTTADVGPGSLRDTIGAANDFDTIQFDPALNGQTILVTSGTITITKKITINGPGPDQLTVKKPSSTPEYHIITVNRVEIVRISGLTFDGNDTQGAAIWSGYSRVYLDRCVVQGCRHYGGLSSFCFSQFDPNAFLQVSNSIIRNNQSQGIGGGIYNSNNISCHAVLTIINSVVSNNTVGSTYPASGGGIYNNGDMDIANSIVSDNVAGGDGPDGPSGKGGGIFSAVGSVLFISACTISGNSAGLNGGGVYNAGPFAHIDYSTVSHNSANGIKELEGWGDGGGIFNSGIMTMTNSTVSTNDSTRAAGGVSNHSSLTIGHSTFSGNIALEGSSIANYSSTVEIGHTVLKGFTAGGPQNIYNTGTVTSHGYNLSNDNGSGVLTATGDQINTDPMLGPLQNNGGPTFTHELLAGSPAIDTGDPSFTPPPEYDQRESLYQRVFNGRIDIGSLEVQPAPPTPTPTSTPTATATATPTPPPPTPTATPTPPIASPTPTQTPPTATPTPTSSPSATPSPSPARALNMSTRMLVETGDRVGIGGFIITGPDPKRVILRGLGPSAGFAIPDKLADPVMELHGPNGFVTITNDNWRDTQETEIRATGIPPTDDLESAIVATLDPGSYTAIVKGTNDTTGVGLVEIYDLDQTATSRLANISTRAFVGTGAHVTIGGFILGGGDAAQIEIYGVGPSLAANGVGGVLADPTLELRDSNGVLLASNDNCGSISIHPLDPAEACIAISLPPGAFTAILAGKNGGTGLGLVEIYNVQ